jgi:aconitate hydratase
LLGDSITTDHISPAGKIARKSPTAEYLRDKDVKDRDFNSYGSRRGNHEVMIRGTFGNIRIKNKMVNKSGPYTVVNKNDDPEYIFNVCEKLKF